MNSSESITIEKVSVRPKMMGYVAGEHFANVLEGIEEKFRVKLTLPTDIIVEGSAENVRSAKLELLENLPWKESCRVEKDYFNVLMREKGETLWAIQTYYEVEIAFKYEMTHFKVTIKGQKENCQEALKVIQLILAEERKVEGIQAKNKEESIRVADVMEVKNQESSTENTTTVGENKNSLLNKVKVDSGGSNEPSTRRIEEESGASMNGFGGKKLSSISSSCRPKQQTMNVATKHQRSSSEDVTAVGQNGKSLLDPDVRRKEKDRSIAPMNETDGKKPGGNLESRAPVHQTIKWVEVYLPIPWEKIGYVTGSQFSNKNRLEREYGVTVTIPRKGDIDGKTGYIGLEGPEDRVDAAAADIMKHLPRK